MTSRSRPVQATCKIDWYSFTLPCPAPIVGYGNDSLDLINRLLCSVFGDALDLLDLDGTWTITQAKGFYSFRATHLGSRVVVSWGEVNAHVFVECPGEACSWLREQGIFGDVVAATYGRASRVDAAIDLPVSTSPKTFVRAGYAERFKDSTDDKRSKTGNTCYVGARKSDRCARVYRYAAPHPRSHLLRVEAEYKGKDARALAQVLFESGELDAVRAAHAPFEWKWKRFDPNSLTCPASSLDPQTNPATENIAGSSLRSSPRSCVFTKQDLLTFERGWKPSCYPRLGRPRHHHRIWLGKPLRGGWRVFNAGRGGQRLNRGINAPAAP